MTHVYVTDGTKELIEKVADADKRTQDGVINFLCSQRLKDIADSEKQDK